MTKAIVYKAYENTDNADNNYIARTHSYTSLHGHA